MSTILEQLDALHAELYVEQSPATVWSYFSDLTQWSRWSPICLECRLVEDVQLGTGSVMRISFRVARITTVVRANVISLSLPNVIAWAGVKFGLSAVHTYRFQSHRTGTLMINEERIFGARFPLSHAMRRWYKASDFISIARGNQEGIGMKKALIVMCRFDLQLPLDVDR